MRQNNTNQHDGVAAVTQCPVAVGESVIYTWKATQYGSSWYHSNFALQEYQGIFGGIIINGPASANYDEDLGVVFLNDWDHQTVDELYAVAQTNGPPMLDNGLINGTNVYGDDDDASQTGQRYDIIVTANQAEAADSFWMRAIPQSACSDNESTDNIKAIVYYGDSVTTPKTIGYDYTDSCDDETDNLVPVVSKAVESADWSDLAIATVGRNSAGLFKWYLNSTSLLVDWADPTLGQVLTGATEWETKNAVLQLSEANKWVYLVVQTAMGVPHPIHLHGHDFFVLAQGSGIYSASVTLNTENPPRRDTALLPASGYLVMAWETDNPGVWLMHCHIGWHASEGFALQFIERYSEIGGISDESSLNDGCSTWSSFQDTYSIEQEDSGI
ncbi:Laccase-1 like protein [Verticillium longisporum]|nr:Laccase-1 like protein [Verticillium longisporum]